MSVKWLITLSRSARIYNWNPLTTKTCQRCTITLGLWRMKRENGLSTSCSGKGMGHPLLRGRSDKGVRDVPLFGYFRWICEATISKVCIPQLLKMCLQKITLHLYKSLHLLMVPLLHYHICFYYPIKPMKTLYNYMLLICFVVLILLSSTFKLRLQILFKNGYLLRNSWYNLKRLVSLLRSMSIRHCYYEMQINNYVLHFTLH